MTEEKKIRIINKPGMFYIPPKEPLWDFYLQEFPQYKLKYKEGVMLTWSYVFYAMKAKYPEFPFNNYEELVNKKWETEVCDG